MSYALGYSQAVLILVYVGDKVRQKLYDFVPTRAIAASLDIPTPTTAKLLHTLVRAGLIEAREGAKGGVRLAQSASKVSLLDVLEAFESKKPLFTPHPHVRAKGERPTRAQQSIAEALAGADAAMRKSLAKTSIQDLLSQIAPD